MAKLTAALLQFHGDLSSLDHQLAVEIVEKLEEVASFDHKRGRIHFGEGHDIFTLSRFVLGLLPSPPPSRLPITPLQHLSSDPEDAGVVLSSNPGALGGDLLHTSLCHIFAVQLDHLNSNDCRPIVEQFSEEVTVFVDSSSPDIVQALSTLARRELDSGGRPPLAYLRSVAAILRCAVDARPLLLSAQDCTFLGRIFQSAHLDEDSVATDAIGGTRRLLAALLLTGSDAQCLRVAVALPYFLLKEPLAGGLAELLEFSKLPADPNPILGDSVPIPPIFPDDGRFVFAYSDNWPTTNNFNDLEPEEAPKILGGLGVSSAPLFFQKCFQRLDDYGFVVLDVREVLKSLFTVQEEDVVTFCHTR